MSRCYLAHHGIKGQKWGIRRYQNRDGTLTQEGKNRLDELTKSNDSWARSLAKEGSDDLVRLYDEEKKLVFDAIDYSENLTKDENFKKLVFEEWNRQGEAVPDVHKLVELCKEYDPEGYSPIHDQVKSIESQAAAAVYKIDRGVDSWMEDVYDVGLNELRGKVSEKTFNQASKKVTDILITGYDSTSGMILFDSVEEDVLHALEEGFYKVNHWAEEWYESNG